jgi:CubicO group peptidase (beta-lactamase class C family)
VEGGPNNPTYSSTACFDTLLTGFLNDNDIPGASVAVLKDGLSVYEQGYGTRDVPGVGADEQRPSWAGTPFRQASVSKPVTSLAIMRLVEQGLIGLDDRPFEAGGVLVESMGLTDAADSRMEDITVRHLLKHTGGWDRGVSGDLMFKYVRAKRAPISSAAEAG